MPKPNLSAAPVEQPIPTTETLSDTPATETTSVIEISNVSKGDIDGQKRDKTAIDIILVRNRPQNRTAITLDTTTMEKKEVPFVEGMVQDKQFGDLFVLDIKKYNSQRPMYATLRLTLDDLTDRIAALPNEAWQPRTKNRR